MIRVLLADDEPLVRERVRALVAAQADLCLVAECGDGLATLEAVRTHKPDLLFLDIQMPGLSGLELAETLSMEGCLPVLIFITAFDHYALAAFRCQALDYLLKPFDAEAFERALGRARTLLAGREHAALDERLQALLAANQARPARAAHLVVREGDRYQLVRTADLHCLEATGNYVCLHTAAATFILRSTLAALAARLDPDRFLRSHRSWIVNLDQIREAQPWTKGSWILVTHGGHKVPLSPQHREALARIFVGA